MRLNAIVLSLIAPSQAALRFGCSTVSIQRLDPLVEPGNTPSAHVHQIVGGNAFNATMEVRLLYQSSRATLISNHTDDSTIDWTAVMFFKHTNGSYKRVPIMQNAALPNGINGGMTIYYTQHDFNGNGKDKITSFKPGFRMTVGSPTTPTLDAAKKNVGLRYVCLNDKNTRFPELPDFPPKPCKGGIMTVHHFPSCWDGKNLDSPDHQSHMFNTGKEAFQPAGPCPASHPVKMPQVAYETLWDTAQFKDMWPADGSNPFVLSFGDQKGYGTHADYLFGWKGDSLQRAMDSSCMFNACENGKPLKSQSVAEMNKCQAKKRVTENLDGCKSSNKKISCQVQH
ncbi:hypothetical protein BU24DRAFT_486322 [Aaosphaeria arxii CBS 175.79]|uniref:DUF1996 domain-containing protein n=1 Tax=Aaosphaeria arxii CBS 175.79 TaxID=1450172 RepID=A0A6A5XGU2_9PLEO|nr:uncharacterized protein BU24DRAFT_486322 [Aaosphaeria arxii CBS 175.79]KAF2011584.1 hypothetical protein BU24DRAFT_486322 [Aaosphaeria arxii CBS 175.79]